MIVVPLTAECMISELCRQPQFLHHRFAGNLDHLTRCPCSDLLNTRLDPVQLRYIVEPRPPEPPPLQVTTLVPREQETIDSSIIQPAIFCRPAIAHPMLVTRLVHFAPSYEYPVRGRRYKELGAFDTERSGDAHFKCAAEVAKRVVEARSAFSSTGAVVEEEGSEEVSVGEAAYLVLPRRRDPAFLD